jgi:hypothetical protein
VSKAALTDRDWAGTVNALSRNTAGSLNTANGNDALFINTTGNNNTAEGDSALSRNTTGSSNIALGFHAGLNLTTGSNNIDIGPTGVAGEANTIRIGKQGTQKSTFIAGIFGTAVTGSQVVVNASGKLGVAASSARFKEAVKPMDKSSEAILHLKPVTFRYKQEIDPDAIPQFGLVAEEVEKVNPDLITRDEEGKPTTVRECDAAERIFERAQPSAEVKRKGCGTRSDDCADEEANRSFERGVAEGERPA